MRGVKLGRAEAALVCLHPGGPEGGMMERRLPAAVIVALIVQTAGALVWAGGAAARIEALEGRVEQQGAVTERLARLEEQAAATRAAIERIEAKLETGA